MTDSIPADRGSDQWKTAYRELENIVCRLMQLMEQDDDQPSMPTDYVLLVGSMFIHEGDRCGAVSIFPKDGSQPAYITNGLVESARWSLNRDRYAGGDE